MTREEQIRIKAVEYADANPRNVYYNYNWTAIKESFMDGAKWADENPSDETIMRVLNCIGYEERSWIDTVRENWDKCKKD